MAELVESLPVVSLLHLLRGALRPRSGAASAVASSEKRYRVDGIDLRQLAAYSALLEFPSGAFPLTFYYLLAQRAHVAAMAGEDFPFRLAGMIHVENSITESVPAIAGRALEISNTLRIEPPAENGARYCVFDTVAAQDGKPVFRCVSRYLAVRGARRAKEKPVPQGAFGEALGSWDIPRNEGRRYAAVSGDWNPIHLWWWSARLMGMQQPIIHGMHTVGKACALLQRASGRRVSAIDARFAAPMALGSECRLEADWDKGAWYVLSGGRLAVEGNFVVL